MTFGGEFFSLFAFLTASKFFVVFCFLSLLLSLGRKSICGAPCSLRSPCDYPFEAQHNPELFQEGDLNWAFIFIHIIFLLSFCLWCELDEIKDRKSFPLLDKLNEVLWEGFWKFSSFQFPRKSYSHRHMVYHGHRYKAPTAKLPFCFDSIEKLKKWHQVPLEAKPKCHEKNGSQFSKVVRRAFCHFFLRPFLDTLARVCKEFSPTTLILHELKQRDKKTERQKSFLFG